MWLTCMLKSQVWQCLQAAYSHTATHMHAHCLSPEKFCYNDQLNLWVEA